MRAAVSCVPSILQQEFLMSETRYTPARPVLLKDAAVGFLKPMWWRGFNWRRCLAL